LMNMFRLEDLVWLNDWVQLKDLVQLEDPVWLKDWVQLKDLVDLVWLKDLDCL